MAPGHSPPWELPSRRSRTPRVERCTPTDAPANLTGGPGGGAFWPSPALGGAGQFATRPRRTFAYFSCAGKVGRLRRNENQPRSSNNFCFNSPSMRPASPQAPYPSLPPLAKAHPFRCGSSPHKSAAFAGTPALRFAGLRRGPLMIFMLGRSEFALRQGFAAQNACAAHPRRPGRGPGPGLAAGITPAAPKASASARPQCGPAPARPPCASGRRPSGSA